MYLRLTNNWHFFLMFKSFKGKINYLMFLIHIYMFTYSRTFFQIQISFLSNMCKGDIPNI